MKTTINSRIEPNSIEGDEVAGDPHDFWEDSEYATAAYTLAPLTADVRRQAETRLGYRLPEAYAKLCETRNGGCPARTCHRTTEPTSWAADHICVTGIYGIGGAKSYSLLGETGSQFWMDEWGYPDIGVYFADCPSAGHDMLCLDYRACGPSGEPTVVHVDQEHDYKITLVADSFDSFIGGLESDEIFEQELPADAGASVISCWISPELLEKMNAGSEE